MVLTPDYDVLTSNLLLIKKSSLPEIRNHKPHNQHRISESWGVVQRQIIRNMSRSIRTRVLSDCEPSASVSLWETRRTLLEWQEQDFFLISFHAVHIYSRRAVNKPGGSSCFLALRPGPRRASLLIFRRPILLPFGPLYQDKTPELPWQMKLPESWCERSIGKNQIPV